MIGFGFYYVVFGALMVAPFWKLLSDAGYNKYFSVGALVMPAGVVILLWLLAYGEKLKGAK